VCIGRQAYGTAFGETRGSADYTEGASQTLAVNGLSYVGKDTLYSGASGIPFSAYIFMGPVFYQKLKHMVMDKMHARARGLEQSAPIMCFATDATMHVSINIILRLRRSTRTAHSPTNRRAIS